MNIFIRRVIEFFSLFVFLIAICFSIYVLPIYLSVRQAQHQFSFRQHLFVQRQVAFAAYDIFLNRYLQHESRSNDVDLLNTTHVLKKVLVATSKAYGTPVLKEIQQFFNWQNGVVEKIQHHSGGIHSVLFGQQLVHFELSIETAVSQENKRFDAQTLHDILKKGWWVSCKDLFGRFQIKGNLL